MQADLFARNLSNSFIAGVIIRIDKNFTMCRTGHNGRLHIPILCDKNTNIAYFVMDLMRLLVPEKLICR